jgi:hypothetical protein
MFATSRCALGLIIGMALATPALACSIVIDPNRSVAEHRRATRSGLDTATAIIDGEVARPFIEGKQTALVYAYHVLKGPAGPWFEIGFGGGGDCSIALDRAGERSRMILSEGPDIYMLFYDQSDARMQDRLLKSDRRRVWPFREGQPAEQSAQAQ